MDGTGRLTGDPGGWFLRAGTASAVAPGDRAVKRIRSLGVGLALVLAFTGVLAAPAWANTQAKTTVTCHSVTWKFSNFPAAENNTINERVRVDKVLVYSGTFVFNGPTASNTVAISVPLGTHTVTTAAQWLTNGSQGERDLKVEITCAPKIEVKKSPRSQSLLKGGSATFGIAVTNTGDFDLENVTVKDLATPSCERAIGALARGETKSYECTTGVLEAPFNNVAKACGVYSTIEVCSESEAHVGIAELASEQDFKPGDTATITVTGTEIAPLNGQVTFRLYKGSCEEANLIYTSLPVKLTAGKATTLSSKLLSELLKEKGLSPETEGTYNWQISYGGDTNGNGPFTGTCGTEHFTVTNH